MQREMGLPVDPCSAGCEMAEVPDLSPSTVRAGHPKGRVVDAAFLFAPTGNCEPEVVRIN